MKVEYPKCVYGPYYYLNQIETGVYILVEVSFCINTYHSEVEEVAVFSKTIMFKKRLLLRCIHHFKLDLINNMDRMRISGTEPSPVILSQTM